MRNDEQARLYAASLSSIAHIHATKIEELQRLNSTLSDEYMSKLQQITSRLSKKTTTLWRLRERQTEKNQRISDLESQIKTLEVSAKENQVDLECCNLALNQYYRGWADRGNENAVLSSIITGLRKEAVQSQAIISGLREEAKQLEMQLERERGNNAVLKKDVEVSTTIAQNAIRVHSKMPYTSPMKKRFVVAMCVKLNLKQVEEAFGMKGPVLSRARKKFNEHSLVALKLAPQKRKPYEHRQRIEEFWRESFPVKSGSNRYIRKRIPDLNGEGWTFSKEDRVPVHVQTRSDKDVFKLFKEHSSNQELKTSFSTFIKYKPYDVKTGRLPTKADLLGGCPHCEIWEELKQKLSSGEQLDDDERELLGKKEAHRHGCKQQIQFYLDLKCSVLSEQNRGKEVLAIHDFTKLQHDNKRYNVLMISVLTYNVQNKKHEWIYIDFVQEGKGGLQDFFFVQGVWLYLLGAQSLPEGVTIKKSENTGVIELPSLFKDKKLYLLSDGAGQHFKQKKTVCHWIELQYVRRIIVELHFFVSYHGHNVCDAHACHLKLRILRVIRETGLVAFRGEEKLTDAISSLKRTYTVVFTPRSIVREEAVVPKITPLLDKPLNGIRSFHRICYSDDKVLLYKLSTDKSAAKTLILERDSEGNVKKVKVEYFVEEAEQQALEREEEDIECSIDSEEEELDWQELLSEEDVQDASLGTVPAGHIANSNPEFVYQGVPSQGRRRMSTMREILESHYANTFTDVITAENIEILCSLEEQGKVGRNLINLICRKSSQIDKDSFLQILQLNK